MERATAQGTRLDLIEIGQILAQRIETKERALYPLYLRPDRYERHALAAMLQPRRRRFPVAANRGFRVGYSRSTVYRCPGTTAARTVEARSRRAGSPQVRGSVESGEFTQVVALSAGEQNAQENLIQSSRHASARMVNHFGNRWMTTLDTTSTSTNRTCAWYRLPRNMSLLARTS